MADKDIVPQPSKATVLLRTELAKYPLINLDDDEGHSIMAALMAETAEEILMDPDSVGLRDITGEPFTLLGIDGVLESTIKGQEGRLYLRLRAARDDGTTFQVTTGSDYAMARAIALDKALCLPRRVCAVEVESKSDPSRTSLWIVDRPLRREAGTTAPINIAS